MPQQSGDKVTTRELINFTAQTLAPIYDRATHWAARRAIVYVCREIRSHWKDDKIGSRTDLRDDLEAIVSGLNSISKTLEKRPVRKALRISEYLQRADKSGTAMLAYEEETSDNPADIVNRLQQFKNMAETIGQAANAAIPALGLEGQRGRYNAWRNYILPAKTRCAALGTELYQLFHPYNTSHKPFQLFNDPNPKNAELHKLLDLLWEIATGETALSDWTAALRSSRAIPSTANVDHAARMAYGERIFLAEVFDEWTRMAPSRGTYKA